MVSRSGACCGRLAGYIYVAEGGANRIQKFSSDGKRVAVWQRSKGNGSEQWNMPETIAVRSDGSLVVEDAGNHRIVVISTLTGRTEFVFGGRGKGPGQFVEDEGLGVDHEGNINFTSPSGKRINSNSFFAGIVTAPSFFTFTSQEVRMLSSRSVAVMVRRLPFASTSRFDRIGIVDLRSTTPCVRFSSSSRPDLFMLNSISGGPRECGTEQMDREMAKGLSQELRDALDPPLEEIESLNERIAECDRRIEQIAREVYPQVAVLKQVKGVGPLIALTFVLTLDNPQRFRRSRDVGCFLGLRPGRRNSGMSEPQLHIGKEGDRYLRTLLVQLIMTDNARVHSSAAPSLADRVFPASDSG